MSEFVRNYIKDSIDIKRNILENEKLIAQIEDVSSIIVKAFKTGNKIILCGNGGSAADAQHIAAEFVGRFKTERKALPAIALTTDTSIITAISNDYGYDTETCYMEPDQAEWHVMASDPYGSRMRKNKKCFFNVLTITK